jgi:hypothetical protein
MSLSARLLSIWLQKDDTASMNVFSGVSARNLAEIRNRTYVDMLAVLWSLGNEALVN